MALLSTSRSSLLFSKALNTPFPFSIFKTPHSLSFPNKTPKPFLFSPKSSTYKKPILLLPNSSFSESVSEPEPELNPNYTNPEPEPNATPAPNPTAVNITDEGGEKVEPGSEPESEPSATPNPNPAPVSITDEWGEKLEPGTEPESEYPKALDSDPSRDDDEWEEEKGYVAVGNGRAAQGIDVAVEKDERIEDLKRCLVDTVYGTDLGFRASSEIRGEVLELVNQLEALNPTPAPVEASGMLDGNWILL